MEGFLKFLLNVGYAYEQSHDRLAPVYKLSQDLPLPETEHPNWQGFLGSRPVRSHNQAAEHVQNDVYGEMILTLAPIFFDNRFFDLRTKDHEALVANLVRLCERSISQPDAGPWEIRNGWKRAFVHESHVLGRTRPGLPHAAGWVSPRSTDRPRHGTRASGECLACKPPRTRPSGMGRLTRVTTPP